MSWLKQNPLLAAGLILGVVALGAEGWALQAARQQAARALAGLAQKKQDRDWLVRQSPALTEANEQAIAQDLVQAGKVLAALREALAAREPAPSDAKVPVEPLEAYFGIAGFVEQMRALAARAQVTIRPEERFGFAAHANEGPAKELVPAVSRQLRLAGLLTEALIEARPRTLLAVQRERPLTAVQREQRNQSGLAVPSAATGNSGGSGDFMEVSTPESLRIPARLESEVFRFEFTGQTPALRAFLNSLAALPLPVVVRRVEVEPLATETVASSRAIEGAAVPLVAQNLSKFAVVVECVELLPAPVGTTP